MVDNNQVFEFLDSIDSGKHIVLFYEEPEQGRVVQFRFINNGLRRNEYCIYASHDDDPEIIEQEMVDNRINVANAKKKNLLRIYKVPSYLFDTRGPVHGFESYLKVVLEGIQSPFRLVSKISPEIRADDEEEKISGSIDAEKHAHSLSKNSNNMGLCCYHVDNIKEGLDGRWMQELLRNHHAVIFLSKETNGIALELT